MFSSVQAASVFPIYFGGEDTQYEVSFVETLDPLVHRYVLSKARDRESERGAIVRALEHDRLQKFAVPPEELTSFIEALRRLPRDIKTRSRIAMWGLFDRPPNQLFKNDLGEEPEEPRRESFASIESGSSSPSMYDFQLKMFHLIDLHKSDPDLTAYVSSLSTQAFERSVTGEAPSTGTPTLNIGGVNADLLQLSMLAPLALAAAYAVFCVSYVQALPGMVSSAPDILFPVYGRALSGEKLKGASKVSSNLPWLVFASLPVGVILVGALEATWPLRVGEGFYFRDEVCSFLQTTRGFPPRFNLRCGGSAWLTPLCLTLVTALTLWVTGQERNFVINNDRPSWMAASGVSFAVVLGTLWFVVFHLNAWPRQFFTESDPWFLFGSVNYWSVPLVIGILMIGGLRNARLTALCAVALLFALPPSLKAIIEPTTHSSK
jgi:hypothetical protein